MARKIKNEKKVAPIAPQPSYLVKPKKDTRSVEQRLFEDKWSKHPANKGRTFEDFLADRRAQNNAALQKGTVVRAVALTGEIITGIDMRGNGAFEYNQTFVNNQR